MSSCYTYCLVSGVVCNECGYPVGGELHGYHDIPERIRLHEKNNKKHSDELKKTTKAQRQEIKQSFIVFNDTFAEKLVSLLPHDMLSARRYILEYTDPLETYPFCSECKVLVVDGRKHLRRQHIKFCKSKGKGYRSKAWINHDPKIITENFNVCDTAIFNNQLRARIDSVMSRQSKMLFHPPINENNNVVAVQNAFYETYQRMLSRQAAVIETQNSEVIIDAIDQTKNPNLWIRHTGWFEYLHHFNAATILTASLPFNERTEALECETEKCILASIRDMVKVVRDFSSSHQVFYEIERQPSKDYPTKRFQLAKAATYDKYAVPFMTAFRVAIRVYRTTFSNTEFPPIPFSDRQKAAIEDLLLPPRTTAKVSEFCLSLIDQSYVATPFECTFVCLLAYMSLTPKLNHTSVGIHTGIHRPVGDVSVLFGVQSSCC